MVKRQTVWLSTMMVLSLMLIGYYTMNNGDSTPNSMVTSVSVPPQTQANGSGAQADNPSKSASKPDSGQKQTGSPSTTTSSSDWFQNTSTQIEQQLSEKQDTLLGVIQNNNSSTDQVSAAQKQLNSLENVIGGMANAKDEILSEGYQDCVIVPIASGQSQLDKVQVVVKTKTLSAADAARIMNIVSQQLEMPITSVSVTMHN